MNRKALLAVLIPAMLAGSGLAEPSDTIRSSAGTTKSLAAGIDFAHPEAFPSIDRYLNGPPWDLVVNSSQHAHYRVPSDVANVLRDFPMAVLRNLIIRFDGAPRLTVARMRLLIICVLSGVQPLPCGVQNSDGTIDDRMEFSLTWMQQRALAKGFPKVDSNQEWMSYYKSLDFRFDER